MDFIIRFALLVIVTMLFTKIPTQKWSKYNAGILICYFTAVGAIYLI